MTISNERLAEIIQWLHFRGYSPNDDTGKKFKELLDAVKEERAENERTKTNATKNYVSLHAQMTKDETKIVELKHTIAKAREIVDAGIESTRADKQDYAVRALYKLRAALAEEPGND